MTRWLTPARGARHGSPAREVNAPCVAFNHRLAGRTSLAGPNSAANLLPRRLCFASPANLELQKCQGFGREPAAGSAATGLREEAFEPGRVQAVADLRLRQTEVHGHGRHGRSVARLKRLNV